MQAPLHIITTCQNSLQKLIFLNYFSVLKIIKIIHTQLKN